MIFSAVSELVRSTVLQSPRQAVGASVRLPELFGLEVAGIFIPDNAWTLTAAGGGNLNFSLVIGNLPFTFLTDSVGYTWQLISEAGGTIPTTYVPPEVAGRQTVGTFDFDLQLITPEGTFNSENPKTVTVT